MTNHVAPRSDVIRRWAATLFAGSLLSMALTVAVPVGAEPNSGVDSDGDGLSDQIERDVSKTDPFDKDSDGDGLDDGLEVLVLKSNPNSKNSDLDSLSDYDEVHKYHTDPTKADTDGDGLRDDIEVLPWN